MVFTIIEHTSSTRILPRPGEEIGIVITESVKADVKVRYRSISLFLSRMTTDTVAPFHQRFHST